MSTDRLAHFESGGWRESPGQTVTGERAELVEWLRGIADGCIGSDAYRAEAALAASQIADGASGAQAGHTWYYVTEDG